jgi:hypothetical protein
MEKYRQMNLLLSSLAVTLGLFAAISPARAALIWGWRNLHELAPGRRALYLGCYRTFGIILCLAGILSAVDSNTP